MKRRLTVLATAAAVISILGACGGGTPAISDPGEIVTKAVSTLQEVKTVHLRADVTGSVQMDMMGGSGGEFPLDGTNLEGAIDIAAKKIQMTIFMPTLMGMKIELIGIDDTSYVKMSLLGDKWQKSTNSGSSDPISSASDPQKALEEIKDFLEKPEVAPKKLADEKVGDRDCYHVQMNLPTDELVGALASSAPIASGAPSITSALLDLWVAKDTSQIQKATLVLDMPETGKLTVAIVLTKYDQAVTIEAPPADQVEEGGSSIFDGLGQ